ncbi:acyltransferase [Chitinophaga terrae (ex Kim and Jung 2007)]|nr:acyltransferase [Chitinophaga terrae (ex Kim and Jung 2007)]
MSMPQISLSTNRATALKPAISYNSSLHIKQLDAVRGCAILLVLLYHFYGEYAGVFNIGWTGVDLFFVLSGFLITGILTDSKQQASYFKNFYIKRVLRIFPIYFIVIGIILYLVPLFSSTAIPDLPYYHNHQGWFWTYFQNWLFTIKGFPDDRVLRYTWSLCIEEQFYMFWPFIIYKFSAKNILRISIGFIVLANVLRLLPLPVDNNYIYVNTFARIDALSVGALIAILIRTRKELLEKYATMIMLVSVIALLGNIAYTRSTFFMNLYPVYTFIALFFGGLIVWSLSSNAPRPLQLIVNNPVFMFFGKYSYGLYLYHVPIHLWLTPWLFKIVQSYIHPALWNKLLISSAGLLVAIAVSVISFRFIETPFLNLKKKLIVKRK